nr:MAG TPA: Prokaryotic membrane lipoprotein lipid attachment site [Caudoviricetes sp.]
MKKVLFICTLLTVLVGCAIKQTPRATLKRGYKENRFTKQFHSVFNQKYLLK